MIQRQENWRAQPAATPVEWVTFEPTGRRVRRIRQGDEWRYVVEDALAALLPTSAPQTAQTDAREARDGDDAAQAGWALVERRLREDGMRRLNARIEMVELVDEEGEARPTRVASAATLLRMAESIPGPAAEGAKEWLARAGAERLAEAEDPAVAIERARRLYARQGYSRDWTQRRLHGITLRQQLTQEWALRGAQGPEYGALTDALNFGAFDLTSEQHKEVKGLKQSASLRDSMTTLELLLLSLAEESALMLSLARESHGFEELLLDAEEAGAVAGATRRDIEARVGRAIVSPANFQRLRSGLSPRRARLALAGSPLPRRADPTPRADTPQVAGETEGSQAGAEAGAEVETVGGVVQGALISGDLAFPAPTEAPRDATA